MHSELHGNGTYARGFDDTFQSKILRKTITAPAHASRRAGGRFFRISRNRKNRRGGVGSNTSSMSH